LINLVTFCDEMTGILDEGKAVDIVLMDFSMAFDIVSRNTLTDKLLIEGLDEQTVRWTENWLNSWTLRVLISSARSSWRPITSGVP